jgi:hypothetical protein
MKRKLTFVFGILVFFCFVSVNCSAQSSTNDQRIVGTWVSESGEQTWIFNSNGTGSSSGNSFTYGLRVNENTIIIIRGNHFEKWMHYFSPDGRTLILESTRNDDFFVFKKR